MKYSVTLSHIGAKWSGIHEFTVKESIGYSNDPVFYAIAENFGCGKYCRTAIDAIRHLAWDNGATVLHIEVKS